MTISIYTRKIKPHELDFENPYSPKRFYYSVTERNGEGNNITVSEEDSNPYTRRYSIRIENEHFTVLVSRTSFDKLMLELVHNTDHLSTVVRTLQQMGFKVEMPNPQDPCNDYFKRFLKELPSGARAVWDSLWKAQKNSKEKETA